MMAEPSMDAIRGAVETGVDYGYPDEALEALDRLEDVVAQRDHYRQALLALVEASEEFFRPRSLGAPLWPRTVEGRAVLDQIKGEA